MTKKSIGVLALAVATLSAGALWLVHGPAAAQEAVTPEADEESVREKVERLLPDLMSESAPARDRAEREILALGEAGRAELDRITRDSDPKKAIVALKLLQSRRWDRAKDEEKAERDDGVAPAPGRKRDLRDLREEIDRQMEELRRRMESWQKQFKPEDWFRDWAPEVGVESQERVRGSSSGRVVENDRSFSWTIDEKGKVKLTVKDGADAAETTVEAQSLDELRKAHPDLAKRLEEYVPQGGGRRFVFSWPGHRRDGGAAAPGLLDGEEPLEPFGQAVEVPGPVLGIGWAPVPDVLRDQLDLPASAGMVVDSVTPGSLAQKLAVRRNDVLVKIAGRPVAGPPDVRKALEGVPTGETVEVEVIRKGKSVTLTATK